MATLPLREIPQDVRKYLLKIQGEVKKRKGVKQYSLCQIIFQIIREHEAAYCPPSKEITTEIFVTQMKKLVEGLEECLEKSNR